MDYLMGIDLGSTSLKAIIYDLEGNAVASGSTPTKKYNPNPDHPEWDQVYGHMKLIQEEYFSYGREYLGWAMMVLALNLANRTFASKD